jgi:hypothetical protein
MKTVDRYQQARILFKSIEHAQTYRAVWTTFIERISVRMLPLTLSTEERELRKLYCAKLTGLPPGTQARDLNEILQKVKAKTCFILRRLDNYQHANYAYLNFTSDEDMQNATNQFFAYNGQELSWCDAKQQLCFKCGAPDHMIRDCPKAVHNLSKKDIKLTKLYNKFRPAQHKQKKVIPQLTYAQVAQTNSLTSPSANSSNATPEQMLLNIQQELNNIKTMVSKLEQNIQQVAILIHNNPKNNTLTPTNQTPLPPIQSLPKQPEQQPVTNDNQNDETPSTDAMQSLATLTNEVKSILQHLNNNTERTNALGEYLKQISSMSPSSSTSRNFQEFLGQHF